MKPWKILLLLAAGVLAGLALERTAHVLPVHAQSFVAGEAACMAKIPKAWGEFKGASSYGLAFEDENGRIRLLKQLPCSAGSLFSDSSSAPVVDLILDRK